MAATDYYPVTQLIYIAYFGRPADPAGLQAFALQLDAARAPTEAAALARALAEPGNAALRALVGGIGASAESAALYGDTDTDSFVNQVFLTVLGRPARLAGLQFWSGEIEAGRVSRAQAALNITAGAFANTTDPQQAAVDQATILRKLEVATYFTGQIDSDAEIDGYRGPAAANYARQLLKGIDHQVDPVAARPLVDSFVRWITGPDPVNQVPPLGNETSFTGGPGRDQVTVGATNRAIAMGGGDDVVVLRGPALGTGSLDGGAGTDTLVMSGADAAIAARGGALAAAIAGFERLELRDVGGGSVNLANLDGIAHVTLVGSGRETIDGLVLDGAPSGTTVSVPWGAKFFTVNVKDAAAGAADVLNLSATDYSGVRIGTITIAGVETVNFVTHHTGSTIVQGIPHSATLLASDVQAITVSGTAGLSLHATSTALRSFDASAQSGDVALITAQLASSAVIKGGSGRNDIDFSAALQGVEYTGGAGRDHVTGNAADNLIKTGAGDDEVFLSAGSSHVDLGSGNDLAVIAHGSASTIAGGEGRDQFVIDSVGPLSGSVYSTIVDIADKEVIRFTGAEHVAASRLGAAVNAGEGASLRQYLDAAAGGTAGGEVRWFVFGGDTYVVNDISGATTFTDRADQLVKLAGVHDLSASSLSGEGVLTVSFG